MPISRGQFEAGNIRPGPAILELLRSNADMAYTGGEITEALNSQGLGATEASVEEALAELVAVGRVEKKVIEGKEFYCAARRLGFRSSGG